MDTVSHADTNSPNCHNVQEQQLLLVINIGNAPTMILISGIVIEEIQELV